MAIYIGGTGDQNKLDDYEEGTWTPSIANGTFTAYNVQWYHKIGRLVTCYFYLYNWSDSSSSTNFVIGGLPFAYDNSVKRESFTNVTIGGFAANFPANCIGVTGRIGQNGNNEMSLQLEYHNTQNTSMTHNHLGNLHMHATFSYYATA